MADTRKKYTKEFKLDAIRLLESGTKPGHEIERRSGNRQRTDLPLAEVNSVRTGRGRSPATASPAMRNWPPCAKRTRSCARNGTS